MITKDKLKKEIDELPEDLLDRVYQFINRALQPSEQHTMATSGFHSIKQDRQVKGKIRSFKLKGQFDDVNIREKAYK